MDRMPDCYHQTHYFVSGKSPDDPNKKHNGWMREWNTPPPNPWRSSIDRLASRNMQPASSGAPDVTAPAAAVMR
jgi:hypothetical protein